MTADDCVLRFNFRENLTCLQLEKRESNLLSEVPK